MNYDNSRVRRQNRLLPETEALHLLATGEYGVLSLVTPENEGYGIPLNYVWDGKDTVYFHCATEGKKIDILQKNPNVSFCIVGGTEVISNKFTTNYQSIILFGTISFPINPEEKMQALELILKKYALPHLEAGKQYTKNALNNTQVLKMSITEFSGKCNDKKQG